MTKYCIFATQLTITGEVSRHSYDINIGPSTMAKWQIWNFLLNHRQLGSQHRLATNISIVVVTSRLYKRVMSSCLWQPTDGGQLSVCAKVVWPFSPLSASPLGTQCEAVASHWGTPDQITSDDEMINASTCGGVKLLSTHPPTPSCLRVHEKLLGVLLVFETSRDMFARNIHLSEKVCCWQ